jgi:hypothetical protein
MDKISVRKSPIKSRASPRRRTSIKKSPRKSVSIEDHQLVQGDIMDDFIQQYAESRGKMMSLQQIKKLKQKLITN